MEKLDEKTQNFVRKGLVYEYSGSAKISIKVYLLCLKKFFNQAKVNIRLLCCCYWINLLKRQILNLINNNLLIEWISFDVSAFFYKYYQYIGEVLPALDFVKKIIYNTEKKLKLKKFQFKRLDLNFYIFFNFLRLLCFVKNRIPRIQNIAKLFYKIKKSDITKKKNFWIINRNLIHFKNKFSLFNRSQWFCYNYQGLAKESLVPLFMKIFDETGHYLANNQHIYELMEKYISIDIKFYVNENKKNSFINAKVKKKSYGCILLWKAILKFSDSYCIFNRNFSTNVNFISKFDQKRYNFIFSKLILKTLTQYVSLDKKNTESYFMFTQIQKKLKIQGRRIKPLVLKSNSKTRKKLVDFNKDYISNLNSRTEELYQKKKINMLLKVSLILILISFRFSLTVKKGGNFRKIIFNENSNKKILLNGNIKLKQENVFKTSDFNGILFLFYKLLAYKTLEKKTNLKRFTANKIINIFASNNFLTKLNWFNFRPVLIISAIKKKKYIKAYNLLRSQCYETPYSIHSWQLLALVEKEIGSAVSKTLRFTLRIIKNFPDSVPGIMFAGNLCSFFGSNGYALSEFFQAYRWKSNSPFLNLSISIQYLNGSKNRKNNSKGLTILLCLCFFFRYKILRYFTLQVILQQNFYSDLLNLEILYNCGRILLFFDINSKAKVNFESVLNFKRTLSRNKKLNRTRKKCSDWVVRRETVFNSIFLDECVESE